MDGMRTPIRSFLPLMARSRNSAGPMHDRRAARGGSRNDQLDFLDEFEADQAFESVVVLPEDIDPNAPDLVESRCLCGVIRVCPECDVYTVPEIEDDYNPEPPVRLTGKMISVEWESDRGRWWSKLDEGALQFEIWANRRHGTYLSDIED